MPPLNINTITIGGAVGAPASLRSRLSFSRLIGDDARVSFFGSVLPGRYISQAGGTVDGLVSRLSNRKATGTVAMTEDVMTAMPALDINEGPRGRPHLRFFASGQDKLTSNAPFPVAGDFFKMAVVRAEAITSSVYMLYSGTTGNRHLFGLSTQGPGQCNMRVGASGAEANAAADFPLARWNLVLGAWNAATKTAGISVNGGAWITATNALAVVDQTANIAGVPNGSEMQISDLAWGPVNLMAVAQQDLLSNIRAYAQNTLGIVLA